MTMQQQEIPATYFEKKELLQEIACRKKDLGKDLLILGHHYQQESVYQFADMTGDSLKLARFAAEKGRDKKYIVFCGVHFMAETADILTSPEQIVILPDLRAGCPMADMAEIREVRSAWDELHDSKEKGIVPITYINSTAAIKAFVGANGGVVCTSSNAQRALAWALSRGEKAFFLPDEHLGRNSALALGIPESEILLWQRGVPLGGNSSEALKKARILLWNGYCTVHMQFTADHVRNWRRQAPLAKVIVHPECRNEVVALSDYYGSTEKIIEIVASAAPGTKWVVGTELNLVDRLKRQHPDKEIHLLTPFQCLCATMYRIKPEYLLWVLDNLVEGKIVNRITVAEPIAKDARVALERMLSI